MVVNYKLTRLSKTTQMLLQWIYFWVTPFISLPVSQCAYTECASNHSCRVSEITGEALCEPSCALNNGGCLEGQACSIEEYECYPQPCDNYRNFRCTNPLAGINKSTGMQYCSLWVLINNWLRHVALYGLLFVEVCSLISVVLVRYLHFSYGLVAVCKVHLHNSYSCG